MLSTNLIERAFVSRDHDRLLRDLAANGMVMPLPLRVKLGAGAVAPVALALRRLAELTYGPTPLRRAMLRRLLEAQREDGGYGENRSPEPLGTARSGLPGPGPGVGAEGDPLATAAAAAALGRLIRDHPNAATPQIVSAHGRAVAALAAMQGRPETPGFRHADDRTDADAALTTAFVLFLLADDPAFRGAARLFDLLGWFDEHEARLDTATRDLLHMARLSLDAAPVGPAIQHAVAA